MKKIISLMLALVVMTMPIQFAAETTPVTYLTLDKAVTLAMENNVELQTIDQKIVLAERDLKDLESDLKDPDLSHSNADEYEAIILQKLYEPKAKQKAIDDLNKEKQDKIDALTISVTETYLAYQKAKDTYTNAVTDFNDATVTYTNSQKQFELGQITETALKEVMISQLSAEYAMNEAENALIVERMSFNQLVGNPLDTEFTLTSYIDTKVSLNYNVTLMLNAIDTYSDTIKSAQEDLDMAKLKFQVVDDNMLTATVTVNGMTRNTYGRPTDYFPLQDAITDAEIALEKAEKEAVLNFRIDYNNLKSKELDVKLKELSLDTAKRAYETNQIKLNLGLITQQAFNQSYNTYKVATQNLATAQNAFYIAHLTFEDTYNLNVVVE